MNNSDSSGSAIPPRPIVAVVLRPWFRPVEPTVAKLVSSAVVALLRARETIAASVAHAPPRVVAATSSTPMRHAGATRIIRRIMEENARREPVQHPSGPTKWRVHERRHRNPKAEPDNPGIGESRERAEQRKSWIRRNRRAVHGPRVVHGHIDHRRIDRGNLGYIPGCRKPVLVACSANSPRLAHVAASPVSSGSTSCGWL